MRIAVYGKKFSVEARPYIENLHQALVDKGVDLLLYHHLKDFVDQHCDLALSHNAFSSYQELCAFQPDFLITIGGDGTILDATTLVRDSGIPIFGINTGRLGFLSNVSKEEISASLRSLFSGKYSISSRSLLSLQGSVPKLSPDLNFAMNEITVSRKDTTAMVTVKVWIDGLFLNNYWADGVILATPTGSTGYSLSCNGPIIMPGSGSLVITPIAPHNLTARPVVIPNTAKIKMEVNSREEQSLVSLDSRIYAVENGTQLEMELANYTIGLVETDDQNFAQTLRNKLMWGMDKRN
jgi:NAD+ kinase